MIVFLLVIVLSVLGILNKLRGKGGSTTMFRGARGSGGMFGGMGAGRAVEQCPSCHQPIAVGQQPGNCPKCGTALGRTQDGKLLIRIN